MKSLNKLSTEELKRKEKGMKIAIATFGGMLIVMLFASMIMMIRDGFSVFVAVPIAFLPLFAALLNQLKKIRAEIENKK